MVASTVGIAIAAILLATGCETSADRLDGSKEKVNEAEAELDQANQEFLDDMAAYKRETDERIAANNRSIADFNAKIEEEKTETRESYRQTVANLEEQNKAMKRRIDAYEGDGKDNWLKFKTEFNRDMDTLGKAFTDLGKNNVEDK